MYFARCMSIASFFLKTKKRSDASNVEIVTLLSVHFKVPNCIPRNKKLTPPSVGHTQSRSPSGMLSKLRAIKLKRLP